LLTCSARIPVFALLLGFLFLGQPAWQAGLAMALLYFTSLAVGAFAAAIINKFLPAESFSSFMMELPLYRRPRIRSLLRQSGVRTRNYATRAGPIIFTLAVVIWLGTTFPHPELSAEQGRLQQSYFGSVGHQIEPVFEPMGVDWRVGVSLITSFAAREVFVSSLALVMNVTDDNEETMGETLMSQMKTATFTDGTLIFTPAVVIGLLAFVIIALQCIATTGVAIREMGSWKFAIFQLVIFNLVAYGVAVGLVQGLRFLGVS
ncbi:MAG: nucleoside recognition domain-containing protein, partial [Pseudobdellovibrionaceae bacterium]